MKKTNKNANAQANATKTPSIYVGMYREIKAAAQTPSAVVKSFYNAALSINILRESIQSSWSCVTQKNGVTLPRIKDRLIWNRKSIVLTVRVLYGGLCR